MWGGWYSDTGYNNGQDNVVGDRGGVDLGLCLRHVGLFGLDPGAVWVYALGMFQYPGHIPHFLYLSSLNL